MISLVLGSQYHGVPLVCLVLNQRLFRETDLKSIMNIVRERHMRLHGHGVRYPEADFVSRIVSERDNPAWGRPQNSWLRSVTLAGSCLVWEGTAMPLVRCDHQEWRHTVGEATK